MDECTNLNVSVQDCGGIFAYNAVTILFVCVCEVKYKMATRGQAALGLVRLRGIVHGIIPLNIIPHISCPKFI